MFQSYIKMAIRSLFKNKLYAAINVFGLMTGLVVYLFTGLIADYEKSHDTFFDNSENIYALGLTISPKADLGFREISSVFSPVGPLIEAEFPDVEHVARTINQEYLLSVRDDQYYQVITFADTALTDIFHFNYIAGDDSALQDPSSVILTASLAHKLFPEISPVGQTITLDHKFDLTVAAVIEDVPANSHFNSNLMADNDLEMIVSLTGLSRISGFELEGTWSGLSIGNNTYVQLPPHLDQAWLENQMTTILENHVSEDMAELIDGFIVKRLTAMNTAVWDMIGMPVIESISILGLMILIVACVNYTNLATAQAMGRAKEVGLRKTMGAGRQQLLTQFLFESVIISLMSMLLALGVIEIVIPLFNEATGKLLSIAYLGILPWLLATVVGVGLLAGAYPAFIITKTSAIDTLRDSAARGRSGSRIRSIMIGIQFGLSIFMLASVGVMYFQNKKIEESSLIFPKDQILNIARINTDDIRPRQETLRNELLAIPGVQSVTYTSQAPFDQSTSVRSVSLTQGDEASEVVLNLIRGDEGLIDTFAMPLLAGRNISEEFAQDRIIRDEDGENITTNLNVLINELGLQALGFNSVEEALGKSFYDVPSDTIGTRIEYKIVGVLPTINYMGLFNGLKPTMFFSDPLNHGTLSILMSGGSIPKTVTDIEDAWDRVIPDYPIQRAFLSEQFEGVFGVFEAMNAALAAFAFIGLVLGFIGLFGLAAFMAAKRTKEVGIRKVLGANVDQIVRLLVWQFSKPVVGAMFIALPLSFLTSGLYLDFFADRISTPITIVLGAGSIALVFAWATVALHAFKVARRNPIFALRYE